jgi:general secretion pathway protein F
MTTLSDLELLNHEILALARAGIPLAEGLREVASDFPRRLKPLVMEIEERLTQGASLDQIMSEQPKVFPPFYRAMVEAGIRSGRLAEALETMSTSVRRVAELRRTIATSLAYPLFLFLLANMSILFVAPMLHEQLRATSEQFQYDPGPVNQVILEGARVYRPWIVPVVIASIVGFVTWVVWNRRAISLKDSLASRLAHWIPGLRQVMNSAHNASFTRLLAALLQHQVTLPEAVRLSSQATASAALQRDADQLAAAMQRGDCKNWRRTPAAGMRSYLVWLLCHATNSTYLQESLSRLADQLDEETAIRANRLRYSFPMWMTMLLGGSITATVAITLLAPWFTILLRMGTQ